jgi:hypothetical protein
MIEFYLTEGIKIMQIFSIYSKNNSMDDLIVIKDGFSVGAFIFNGLWACYKKMWLLGGVTFIVVYMAQYLKDIDFQYAGDFLQNLVLVAYGILANDFLSYKLDKSGYNLKDVMIANTLEDAELLYLRKFVER